MAPRTGISLLVVLVVALAGCGDDDTGPDAGGTTSSAVTSVDADAGDDGTDEDPPGDETTTTSSTVPDAEAEAPPDGSGGEAEGATDDFVYVADLTGDDGRAGRAELRPGDAGELCVDMRVTGLGSGVTGAHVHESQDGAEVVTIGDPTAIDGDTASWDDVCVEVDDAVVEALAVNAPGFHVDVHTADHPDFAVRGQLAFATIFDLELP